MVCRSLTFLLAFLLSTSLLIGASEPISIQKRVEQIIEQSAPMAQVGIVALSLKGEGAYHRNPDKLYVPGSALKLFVAAAALDLMGPDYCFATQIVTQGVVENEALVGDCYLIASGDPSLDLPGLTKLILGLKARGIKKIKGNFLLDVSLFDDIAQGPGWMWDEKPSFWCSPLDALNVEHNCIFFEIGPGLEMGQPCRVHVYPEFEGLEIINRSETGNKKEQIEVRRLSTHRFELVGCMGLLEEKVHRYVPACPPRLLAQNLLTTLLRQNQIELEGTIEEGKAPRSRAVLATYQSKPLSELLKQLLKQSDNLYADALFKKIGAIRYQKQGTWHTGRRAMCEFLRKKVGLNTERMVIVDGSGTSRYNLLSPKQMALFLQWVDRDFPQGKWIKQALARGGVDGTLKNRMRTPDLKNKVLGKTGTMTGISSLCGFLGEEIALVIFVNSYVQSGRGIKKNLEDQVCKALLQFPPPLFADAK